MSARTPSSLTNDDTDDTDNTAVIAAVAPEDEAPGRPRKRRWPRVLLIVGLVLVVLAGAAVGGGFLLVHRYESEVSHADILGDAAPNKQTQQEHWKSAPLNLLLLGSDSRQGETNKGVVAGERSDTIMLLHISAARDSAAVISIPRDSYVDVPAGGPWKGGPNKLNAAFAFGGAPLAAKAIIELTGVPLDGAMVVRFAGLRTMVDAVGGVTVCVDYDVKSSFSTKIWRKGCHDMDGADAEEFMRERKNVPGGDIGREHQQQLVVQGVIQKVSQQGLLANPLTLDRLLVTAAQSITVDNTVDLRQLALTVKDIKPAAVQYVTVPFSSLDLKTPAGSAVQLNTAKADELFAAVKSDTVGQWLAANPPQTRGQA